MANPTPVAPHACSPDGKGVGVHVLRSGKVVTLAITSRDEYGAIELYEHIARSLERGNLALSLASA